MTRILGLVGSARRWGNSELVVRQVLRGAREQDASTEILRLTSLHLEPCTGCMRCVIGAKSCRLRDHMRWLIDTVDAVEALVLGAPTYFLGPAAIVKLILDRMMMVTGRVEDDIPAPRPAVTIATAGLKDWRGVTLPYLNALVAAFGFQSIESLTAVAPGPGDILLDEGLMERAFVAGRRLGRGELEPAPAPPNVCPVCHNDAFILRGRDAICPICALVASIHEGVQGIELRFDPAGEGNHRWTQKGLRSHMVDWVMATGPRYMAKRPEIKARRRPFRQEEPNWLCPPEEP